MPAGNDLLAQRIADLTAERDTAKYKLAGVLDEISDFCASLDGALMANQSADDLVENIQLRLSHYRLTDADREIHPDDVAADNFAAAMKFKLAIARAKGRSGWDDKENCSGEFLASQLVAHLNKANFGTFEDIANFAMMLHQRGESPLVLTSEFIASENKKIQAYQDHYAAQKKVTELAAQVEQLQEAVKACHLSAMDRNFARLMQLAEFKNPAQCLAARDAEVSAKAVMNFADVIRGAHLSGFVPADLNVYDVYQTARNHVKDNYGVIVPAWDDEDAKQIRQQAKGGA
ncbi:hypothetical protein [Rheinheimera sp.]|uniref:hypothetical protein n=1 Tax=Rheinheimera sp. TaxID=1869214 RepID=UPI002732DDFC|nr:hypothetical protein [Rheinheimera sp.]MDP2715505.1 hypothetical protein [Rheinheimera sp.]